MAQGKSAVLIQIRRAPHGGWEVMQAGSDVCSWHALRQDACDHAITLTTGRSGPIAVILQEGTTESRTQRNRQALRPRLRLVRPTGMVQSKL